MNLSEHLSRALEEERRTNARLLGVFRAAGVGAFACAVAALAFLGEDEEALDMLGLVGAYLLFALFLLAGSWKIPLVLKANRFAVLFVDMPMVLAIQLMNIHLAIEAGNDPRPFSEFGVSLFIALLMLSAFTLDAVFLVVSFAMAACCVQFLQYSAGSSLASHIFSFLILAITSGICVFAGRNRLALVERVAGANARRLRLQRYFSPGVGEMLETWDEDELSLGRECELSVLFIDIRGFTGISERMKSSDVVRLLNSYHSHMVEAIFRHGGTLDKYLGDGLIAYFNAPFEQDDHAVRAVRCALDMQKELEALNEERKDEGNEPLRMGIGIHTGGAIVGDIGAPHRREFTAIGSTVNIASRLEAKTKTLGTAMAVSEATAKLVPEIEWIDLGEHAVRGARSEVRIFSPKGDGD